MWKHGCRISRKSARLRGVRDLGVDHVIYCIILYAYGPFRLCPKVIISAGVAGNYRN